MSGRTKVVNLFSYCVSSPVCDRIRFRELDIVFTGRSSTGLGFVCASVSMVKMKVLVVGGGLGGLCLANGLHNAGIQVHVFERHASANADMGGYFIHLEYQGMRALQHCLNEQGWKDFLATSTPTGAKWAFRDPQLGLIAMRDDEKITGKPLEVVSRRAMERWELRAVLLKALGSSEHEIMHWGKTFTHYENIAHDRVRAYFSDGTSEDGDVLIGADGSKSKVREQRLPHVQREDLGILIIVGRYPLRNADSSELPELMKDSSLNNIVPYGRGWLFVSSWHSQGTQDANHESDDYTLWAYFVPKDETPAEVGKLKTSELRDIALAGVSGWAASIDKIVRDADLNTITPVYLQCAPHLDHWDASRTTLLGDAIHNMTPAAGIGANTALRDAQILTDSITAAKHDNSSVSEAIGRYESEMRPYANAAVALSRQIAEGATSTSFIQRLVFRIVLRLAQLFPPIMRATIGRGAVESYMSNNAVQT